MDNYSSGQAENVSESHIESRRQADRPEAGHRETESRKTDRESGENLSADPVPGLEDGHTETDRETLVRIHEQETGQRDGQEIPKDRQSRRRTESLLSVSDCRIHGQTDTGKTDPSADGERLSRHGRRAGHREQTEQSSSPVTVPVLLIMEQDRSRDRTVCRSCQHWQQETGEKTSDFILSKGITYCHI